MSGVDLVQWLRDQLDEDADLVARNSDGHGLSEGFPDYRTYDGPDLEAADEYVDVFGPARVLREIDAKRQLLDLHELGEQNDGDGFFTERCMVCDPQDDREPFYPCQTLRLLALPYADRPGYAEALAAAE